MSDLVGNVTVESIIRAMVGRDVSAMYPKTRARPGPEVLRVEHLTREGVFTDVSFSVHAGEIVALSRPDGRRAQRGGPGDLRHR